MAKRAVLVGCNYPGTNNELHGCVNDVFGMYKMLVDKFGFTPENVLVLVDTDSNYLLPTGANIREALHAMVQDAKPGDTFFFHFSGHGIRIPVDAGEVDDTGFDECICPCDCNFIEDDDFRELISVLPGGTTFTIVSDSCQSGGLIDRAKEQIGNSFEQLTVAEVAPDPLAGNGGKPSGGGEQRIVKKELSAESVVEMLRKQSGREDIEVGNLRSKVWDMFGEEASSKVKKQAKGIGSVSSRSVPKEQPVKKKGKGGQEKKVVPKKKKKYSSSSSDEGDNDVQSHDTDDEVEDTYDERSGDVDDEEEEGSCNDEDEEESPDGDDDEDESPDGDDEEEGSPDADDEDEESRDIDDEIAATYAHVEPISGMDGNVGVLVSGCQSHQTSADVRADPPHGALTNGIITVLQMLEPGEPITNRQLVMRIRRYLASHRLTQEPGLYCSDEKADRPFICTPVN